MQKLKCSKIQNFSVVSSSNHNQQMMWIFWNQRNFQIWIPLVIGISDEIIYIGRLTFVKIRLFCFICIYMWIWANGSVQYVCTLEIITIMPLWVLNVDKLVKYPFKNQLVDRSGQPLTEKHYLYQKHWYAWSITVTHLVILYVYIKYIHFRGQHL